MKLKKLVKRYNSERDNCALYEKALRRSARRYREFAGSDDFEYTKVNAWLTELQRGVSSQTVRNYRRHIITLWTYAATIGTCDYPDHRRIKQIKLVCEPPRAFSPEDLRSLCDACGSFEKASGDFWHALIVASYDTGLRRGDMLRLPRSVEDGKRFVIVESKTGMAETRQLSERGAELLCKLPPNELAFPWHKSMTTFARQFDKITKAAGVEGTFKYLRRTFVTLSGWRHADPNISKKHYIDQTLVDEPVPRPPSI